MNPAVKLQWLRRVLMFKVVVCLLMWGLPSLLAPAALLQVFGVTMPADPIYLRLFGASITGVAFLYYLAWRDPVKNRDMVLYGVVDNVISSLTLLALALTSGLPGATFYVSLALTVFFAAAFYLLLPEAKKQSAPALKKSAARR